ncbi:H-NS histone family protein [Paraburkholderia sp. MMS20-SJTR3]|uniref:H-NS histone family protein n=1 Tax=Paraburkholderia sejongensis TaxID=2886946 RepID=A0ABS8JRL4_9BURK|nr:H-NS family nucleoid-associated regulatory protein [Paraburkholderia sp. MMS20-SJTR3]MCC8392546.1 H-NS histone family protein [Paraburkholderia sp. MMS20-SJTR3]
MATLASIQAKIAKLQAQKEALAAKDSAKVIGKIRSLMEQHALTIADIEASVGKRRGRKPAASAPVQEVAAARYVDPKTGATWSGRGRAPGWIAAAKDRSKFLVAGAAQKPATVAPKAPKAAKAEKAAAKAPKTAKAVSAPQAAMYQDPKTGATWSGRGRAPAWIAGAKDRTKFLIAAATKPVSIRKARVGKAAVASPATAKKVADKNAPASKPVAKKVSAKKAAAPARNSTPKTVDAAQSPVSRKPRAAKAVVKSTAPVETAAPQSAPESVSTSAEA